ncbi:MAG: alkaline phosphatase D family protein [Planctomycetota bacterium]
MLKINPWSLFAIFAIPFLACHAPAVLSAQSINSDHQIQPISSIKGIPKCIGFGSCSKQTKPQPILEKIVKSNPDLFIYLGDNIYGDTRDMRVLANKYSTLGSKPEFQNLAAKVPLLSIWDDHDYGWNDGGKEYPFKAESRDIFFEFWQVPPDSERRQHKGIYGVHEFTDGKQTLQVILLDTRTFRDPLKKNQGEPDPDSGIKNSYQPDNDNEKTFLGDKQWKWLQNVLSRPADLRVICTSIQFGHEYNGWESWTNFPKQQQKMFDLIKETKANGVVFISGDVHWGELSRRDVDGLYPIFDMTASGLTETWYNVEPNQFRVGNAVRENHFGLIRVNWDDADPNVVFQIVDIDGTIRLANSIKLKQLKFAKNAEADPAK